MISALLISSVDGYSQTRKIDKLKKDLSKASTDSIKVELLYQLGGEYWDFDFEQGLTYSKQCLQLAEKIKSPKGIAQGNTNIGLYYYFNGDYNNALIYYQRAIAAVKARMYGHFPAY